jgi:tripartite-type tricarboxylate transporter receptor subunit TctC
VSISERRKTKIETTPIASKSQRTQRRLIQARLQGHPLRVNATNLPRRHLLHVAAGAALLPAVSRVASAQVYPSRPVRVIVPYAAGSAPDLIARLIGQKLSENLGNQFYIENIGGAGGNIGTGRAMQAAPDGYTVLVIGSNYVINPALYNKVPYDPLKSFDPVALAGVSNVLLTVNPSVTARTVNDLIALIKAAPGKYSYASGGGIGSPGHLVGEQFRLSLGLDLVHVPFNGSGLAIGSVVAGHTPICFAAPAAAVPVIQDGQLRALAGTGKMRLQALPDVPTMAEAGYPNIDGENWYGFVVLARTPKQIITLLNRETVKILGLPELKARFATLGIEPAASTPEEFSERIAIELPRWREVVRAAKIKVE